MITIYNICIAAFLSLNAPFADSAFPMLRYYEKLLFIETHERRKNTDHLHIATMQNNSHKVTIQLSAFGEELEIIAYHKSDSYDSNVPVEIHDKDGVTITTVKELGVITYHGQAIWKNDVQRIGVVYGSFIDGILNCRITLTTKKDTYNIESSRPYCSGDECWYNAILYRGSDVLYHRKPRILSPLNMTDSSCYVTLETEPYSIVLPFDRAREVSVSDRDEATNRTRRNTNIGPTYRVCYVEMVSDHTFFQFMRRSRMNTVTKLKFYLDGASDIFKMTDFNGNGKPDYIQLLPAKFTIFRDPEQPDYPFPETTDMAEALSHLANRIQEYCLLMAMVDRHYDGADIGIAYQSSTSTRVQGGLCQKPLKERGGKRSYNIGLVTGKKNSRHYTDVVVTTTFAHEIGHSFGSPHDSFDDPRCVPSDSGGGYYLMFSYLTDGYMPNNHKFSPCSIEFMNPVISMKDVPCPTGDCLVNTESHVCGNAIVEEGEECDCGSRRYCDEVDRCCSPPGGYGTDPECTIRRSEGSQCSPEVGECCGRDCKFLPNGTVCQENSFYDYNCQKSGKCTGTSDECKQGEVLENGYACGGTEFTCKNGICNSTVCQDNDLKDCICNTVGNERCQVCCIDIRGRCIPATKIGLFSVDNIPMNVHHTGTQCSEDSEHMCDQYGMCVGISEQRIDAEAQEMVLHDFLKRGLSWVVENWLYMVLGILLVLCIVGVVASRLYYSARDKKLHKRAARRMAVARQSVDTQSFSTSMDTVMLETFVRLLALFPTVPVKVLRKAAQRYPVEYDAVRFLVKQGYTISDLDEEESLPAEVNS